MTNQVVDIRKKTGNDAVVRGLAVHSRLEYFEDLSLLHFCLSDGEMCIILILNTIC